MHCTVLPLLLAAMPIVGLSQLLDDRVEWAFLISTAVIGGTAHVRAYRHNHGHVVPGLIFGAGFSLVFGARLLLGEARLGPLTVAAGGVLAAASHYANLRLCRCCAACRAPDA